jgi:hypothetical protein
LLAGLVSFRFLFSAVRNRLTMSAVAGESALLGLLLNISTNSLTDNLRTLGSFSNRFVKALSPCSLNLGNSSYPARHAFDFTFLFQESLETRYRSNTLGPILRRYNFGFVWGIIPNLFVRCFSSGCCKGSLSRCLTRFSSRLFRL